MLKRNRKLTQTSRCSLRPHRGRGKGQCTYLYWRHNSAHSLHHSFESLTKTASGSSSHPHPLCGQSGCGCNLNIWSPSNLMLKCRTETPWTSFLSTTYFICSQSGLVHGFPRARCPSSPRYKRSDKESDIWM